MLSLNDGRSELWQWDTGRTLAVDADCSQVHFSNKVFGRSIDVDVVGGAAIIPDVLLQTDNDLNVWAFVGTSENGYTKISKTFKVNRRNKPADYVFTPVEQTTIDEIAAIAQSVRDDADAGAFDGEQGPIGPVGPKGEQGEKGDVGPQGPSGPAGADGKDGVDGITPTIGENGNWYLGYTDTGKPSRGETGPRGETGATGEQGPQGPVGETGAAGLQGPPGTNGKDGRGITSITGNTDGSWTITYTDGTTETVSNEAYQAIKYELSSLSDKSDELKSGLNKLSGQIDDQIAVLAPGIVETAAGETIVLDDSSDRPLQGLRIYGKTTQDGTPTPEAPVEMVSVGGGGSIAVNIGTSQEDTIQQTLSVPTPNGLPGIKVKSGGNYTDADGQQWICDDVDFAKGVYVQRICSVVYDGSEAWQQNNSSIFLTLAKPAIDSKAGIAICNIAIPVGGYGQLGDKPVGVRPTASGNYIGFFFKDNVQPTVNEWKNMLAGKNAEVNYILKNQIEHILTAEELAAYAAIHTNKPNTTFYNDAGAHMEVQYVADTKLYIDKQFVELRNAVVSLGANV